ncbi:hypothetical protein HWV62_19231 [Athelia sp. TMB]|nr:hypothetical protein HWV62_19231 [Athelia sp. TMB]
MQNVVEYLRVLFALVPPGSVDSHPIVPLICIKSLGNYVVILDKADVAFELLDKRSKIYSDRPEWPCADYLGTQNYIGFMYYGERLIKSRKLIHIILNPQAISQWDDLLDRQSIKLVDAVAKTPKKVNAAIEGWSWDALGLLLSTPQPPFEQVKEDMRRDTAERSFVRNCLEEMNALPHLDITEESIMYNAGGLHAAHIHNVNILPHDVPPPGDSGKSPVLKYTQYAELNTFRFTKARAYAEIHSVVGTDRLPTLADKAQLPYLETVIKELLRFAPPVPLNPHGTSAEDEYSGWTIPKKAWVIANIWSMTHDETSYPSPEQFIPDRHAGPDPQRDPYTLCFGFGRRICPGIKFANTFIFLGISRALALFEISPPKGHNGKPVLPNIEYTTKFIS